MGEISKERIRKVLAEKKKQGDALYQEMVASQLESETITIESLYSQLQTLKHDIDIEVILSKLKTYDRMLKLFTENEETILALIKWFEEKKGSLDSEKP